MTTQLILGDCLEEMKKIPDKSVDLFICDLPYGETNCKWDSVIDLEKFWIQFKRIRNDKRTACIHFCSSKFGYTIIKSWEKGFKMDMVWKKRNKTGGLSSKYRPLRNHEMIYFFYEQCPKYKRDTYHKRINNVMMSDTDTVNEIKNVNKSHERKATNFEPVQPGSVFESTKVFIGKRHHQTEKPQDVLEFLIKYYSDEGDTICDPTMGSGSMGVASKKLGRNFIGIEMDESIFKVAEARINTGL